MSGTDATVRHPRLPAFERRLGEPYRVRTDSGAVDLTLIEAGPLPVRANLPTREPFFLVFRGPNSPRLSQGTYAFEHEAIGTSEIFIVPIVPDDRGPRYEAIFN